MILFIFEVPVRSKSITDKIGLRKVITMKNVKRVALPHRTGYAVRLSNEIICLQSFGNYTWIHFDDGEKFLVCKLLSKVIEKLDDNRFLRTHRSYAINAVLLKDNVELSENADFLIYKDFRIQISKRYRRAITLLIAS